ncbi:MAG: A/G-specific adenine glycosylase [Pseudomonadota bacterium]
MPRSAARLPDDRLHNAVLPPRQALLAWYDRNRRRLPWRALPGETPDAYAVWLSEIMLQQTTVATVTPRYQKFLTRWPTVQDLAAAPLDDVLGEWAGLGYYARARNLHACAQAVVDRFGGVFPDNQDDLASLPGIGAYSSASIAAIAFDRPASVVDGNVERIVARLNAIEDPMPSSKPLLKALAAPLFLGDDQSRPGDFAQAMMDLGATICVPARPKCDRCPWPQACRGRAQGIAETLPRKVKKTAKPHRYGLHYWVVNSAGQVLFHRRPDDGLLGGMLELPHDGWRPARRKPDFADLLSTQRWYGGEWLLLPGEVTHSFSHFDLTARIALRPAHHPLQSADDIPLPKGDPAGEWRWVAVDEFGRAALPSVTAKMVRHAMTASAEQAA